MCEILEKIRKAVNEQQRPYKLKYNKPYTEAHNDLSHKINKVEDELTYLKNLKQNLERKCKDDLIDEQY